MNSGFSSRSWWTRLASLTSESRVALGARLTDPLRSGFPRRSSSSFHATLTARTRVRFSHVTLKYRAIGSRALKVLQAVEGQLSRFLPILHMSHRRLLKCGSADISLAGQHAPCDVLCAEASLSGPASPPGCPSASNRRDGQHGDDCRSARIGSGRRACGLACGLASGVSHHPVWLLARMALNAIDGMLAREFHQKSVLGGYLNEIGDVVSDAALYAPFAFVAPFGAPGIGRGDRVVDRDGVRGRARPGHGARAGMTARWARAIAPSSSARSGLWVGLSLPLPAWLGWAVPILAALLLSSLWSTRVRAGIAEAEERHGLRDVRADVERLSRREDLPDARWRRVCFIATGRQSRARRAAPSSCSTAATSIPAAWRTLPTSSTCPISPCSPGMRAGRAARPASADSARVLARRCATSRRSSITSQTTYGIAAAGHRGGRPERWRGARRHMGPRLRAEHPLHGARLAGLPGQAVCAICAQRH